MSKFWLGHMLREGKNDRYMPNHYFDFDDDVAYESILHFYDETGDLYQEEYDHFIFSDNGTNKFIFDLSDYQTVEELHRFYGELSDHECDYHKNLHSFHIHYGNFEKFKECFEAWKNNLEIFE